MTERDNLIQRIWKALRPPSANPGQRVVHPRRATAAESRPVLVVVEGGNDIEFLRRASVILHAEDAALPVLSHLERRGRIVFVPFAGDPRNWVFRFAHLGQPEFHLINREVHPGRVRHGIGTWLASRFVPQYTRIQIDETTLDRASATVLLRPDKSLTNLVVFCSLRQMPGKLVLQR